MDTNTGVEDQKGGQKAPWGILSSPAIIGLSEVGLPAYLPV